MSAPELADLDAGDDDAGDDLDDQQLDHDDPDDAELVDADPDAELVDADPAPDPTPEGEPNVAEVELTDDDLGGGLFSGTEDSDADDQDGEIADDADAGDDDDQPDVDPLGDLEGNAGQMEDAINAGMSRLAVAGLTDGDFEDSDMDKTALQTEFEEIFGAFRLGYFGSRVVEDYVLTPDDGEVAPEWGLLGSALVAAGLVLWMRPDGDEKMDSIRDAVGGLAGGAI